MFNAIVKNLLLNALKVFDTDIDKVRSFVEDQLIEVDRTELKSFLRWISLNDIKLTLENFEDCIDVYIAG
jgi:hypothetical protein